MLRWRSDHAVSIISSFPSSFLPFSSSLCLWVNGVRRRVLVTDC